MANEPERPIESLLRAAAKKRRDESGVPLELHPANRRLLQGEVARKYAKPVSEKRSFAEMFGQLWPRFAGGAAIFAVLALAVYVLVPGPDKGKPETLLAKNEPLLRKDQAKQPLPSQPLVVAMTPASPTPAPGAVPQAVAVADKPAPALATPVRRLGTDQEALAKDRLAIPLEVAAGKKVTATAAPQLADRKEVAEAKVEASGGPLAQVPAGAVSGALERRYGLASQPIPPASMPAAPASPAPVATPPAAVTVVAANESASLAGDKAAQSGFAYKSLAEVASANRPKPASTTTDSLLRYAAEAHYGAKPSGTTQWFAQVTPESKTKFALADKAAPAHPVLASFQVEQAGPALRIVDGDGSVYSGYVQIAAAARRQRSTKAESSTATRAPQTLGAVIEEIPTASRDSDHSAQPSYSFRVAGTNRSLNKKVVFTGNLTMATNLVLLQAATNYLKLGGGVGGFQAGAPQPGVLPLLQSRILGKVVVGNGKAVEINAIPTSP
jgi:hypothetical protein